MTQNKRETISKILRDYGKKQSKIVATVIKKIDHINGVNAPGQPIRVSFEKMVDSNITVRDIEYTHRVLKNIYDQIYYSEQDFSQGLSSVPFLDPKIIDKPDSEGKYHQSLVIDPIIFHEVASVVNNKNSMRFTNARKTEMVLDRDGEKPIIIITETKMRLSFTDKECPAGGNRHVIIITLLRAKSPIQTKAIQAVLGKNYNVSSAVKDINNLAKKAGFTEKIIDHKTGYFLNKKTYNFRERES